MSADATVTPLGPKALGILGAILSQATPAQVKDLIAEAGIGKASEKISEEHMQAGQVDDLWDGGPDEMPRLQRISRGASGNHAGGGIPVGRPQAASGDGAVRMEDTYSPMEAAQSGVTEVTTRLGKMLSGMRAQMKSFGEAVKAQDMQMSVLAAALTKAIEGQDTLAKAVEALKVPVAKGETDETEKDRDEAEEEEMEKAEREHDEEDEKEAAKSRVRAKLQLKAARKAAAAIRKAAKTGNTALVKAEQVNLRGAVAKAAAYFDLAKVQNPEALGLAAVEGEMQALKKALKGDAENQDIWPASKSEHEDEEEKKHEKETAKSEHKDEEKEEGEGKSKIDTQAIVKATEQLSAALAGVGMLQSDMRSVMQAIGGQSRNQSGLPPVFDLMKSDPGKVVSLKKAEIKTAYTEGKLSRGEADLANDIVVYMEAAARGHGDQSIVEARMRGAPPAVRQIFAQAA